MCSVVGIPNSIVKWFQSYDIAESAVIMRLNNESLSTVMSKLHAYSFSLKSSSIQGQGNYLQKCGCELTSKTLGRILRSKFCEEFVHFYRSFLVGLSHHTKENKSLSRTNLFHYKHSNKTFQNRLQVGLIKCLQE